MPIDDDVQLVREKLRSPNYSVASETLGQLTTLPPEERDAWVPLMLDNLGRFENNSEWSWIVECLGPHFQHHRERIEGVFRDGLKSDYAFGPESVFECLHQIGPDAASLVPDVLAYISRQRAFTNEPPYLVHIDPTGGVAVPALTRLLGDRRPTVRYQAATELEAYGQRAASAVPELTKMANAKESEDDRLVAVAAQRALLAIDVERAGGTVPEKLSQTDRLFGVLEQAISEEPKAGRPKRWLIWVVSACVLAGLCVLVIYFVFLRA